MFRYELIAKIILALEEEAVMEMVPKENDYISGLVEKPPSKSTVLRWMHYLEFSNDKVKKSYYVNGHEKEEQVQHRSKLINTYLSKIEPFTHRWVQMRLDNFQTMQSLLSKDEHVILSGHKYWDHMTNVWWMEFHVEDHNFCKL
jgi:hypothetical protein